MAIPEKEYLMQEEVRLLVERWNSRFPEDTPPAKTYDSNSDKKKSRGVAQSEDFENARKKMRYV